MSYQEELEKSVRSFQDELLEDSETFQKTLRAFRAAEAKKGSDAYYTLYGELYASLTQLISSAEAVQEQMDKVDELDDLLSESSASKVA